MPSDFQTLRRSAISRRGSLGMEVSGSTSRVICNPAELVDAQTTALYIFDLETEVIRQANVISRLRRLARQALNRRGYDSDEHWAFDLERIASELKPDDLHD